MNNDNKKLSGATSLRQKTEDLRSMGSSVQDSPFLNAELQKMLREIELLKIEIEQKNEELQLTQANEKRNADKYQNLYDFAPFGYLSLSAEGHILEVNYSGAALIGIERKDLKNKRFANYISGSSKTIFKKFFEKVLQSNQIGFCEIQLEAKKGLPVFVHITGVVTKNREQFLLTVVDISVLNLAEKALSGAKEKAEFSKKYYDAIINNMGDPVFVKDERSRFLLINDAFCKFFDLPRTKIIGKTLVGKVKRAEKDVFIKIDKQVLSTGQENINEETITIRGQHTRIISTRKTRLINKNGEKFLIGVIHDITERKKQQELLLYTILKVQEDEKNKFGRELHDGLGQVLTSASMYIESLRSISDIIPEDKRIALEKVQALNKCAIIDARKISHGLMTTGLKEYGIQHLILKLCNDLSSKNTTFTFVGRNINESAISYELKIQLYRIIQELSNNIIKHAQAKTAKIYLSANKNKTFKLIVSDNGIGFDILSVNYGAGYISLEQRIKFLNGEISVNSAIGKGTSIKINIPFQ